MKIELINGVYVASIAYAQRLRFRTDGWHFNATLKKWTTRDRKKVLPFLEFCVGDAANVLKEQIKYEQQQVAPSFATEADIDIPAPLAYYISTRKPYAYHPFQKAGIEFAAQRPNTLLADPPGLGKTIQAIGVSNLDPSIRDVLVIAPAFLKIHWLRTWEEWDVKHLSVGIASAKQPWPQTEVVIINPEIIDRFDDEIKSKEWGLLVVDECHYYSNKQTRRAKVVFGGNYKIKDKKVQADSGSEETVPDGNPDGSSPDPALAPV